MGPPFSEDSLRRLLWQSFGADGERLAIPWRSFISAVSGRQGPLTADPGVSSRPATNQQELISSSTVGRKLYESGVHPGFGWNEITFGKVANSSRSGLCGTPRRSGPYHDSTLSESHRRSEPRESARSRDGIASRSDVGNSGNQTTGRNSGKRAGFTDLGPEKWPNPTQSEIWRAVSSPAIGNVLSSCSPIVIRPK
jgi:hypothetical protein